MKNNNWKSMVGCGVAAMTICMGAMTAMAAGTEADAAGADESTGGTTATVQTTAAQITKELKLAEGITIPGATFKFTATKITADAPDATITDITYSDEDLKGDMENGVYLIDKSSNITFGTFPHAGEYQYTVEETANTYNTATGESMVYSTEVYTMHVYVINTSNGGTEVDKITATNTANDKVDTMKFENIYAKNDASLTISKTTEGKHADRTKDFTFTLTFTKSATADADTYTGIIGTGNTTETVTFKAGEAKTFELHNGENIVFTNLPAGTRYVVEETGTADYTPSVKVVENGTQTVDKSVAKGESLASAETNKTNLIGEGTNTVDFTNTYADIPITGLILNNLPFAILIGAAAALLALGTFAKKFKTEK